MLPFDLLMETVCAITDRIRSDNALHNSNSIFKESQRASFIGSYRLDIVTGVWESSEVLDEIFGVDSDFSRDVQGCLSIVHAEDVSKVNLHLVEYVVHTQKCFSREYRIFGNPTVKYDGVTTRQT